MVNFPTFVHSADELCYISIFQTCETMATSVGQAKRPYIYELVLLGQVVDKYVSCLQTYKIFGQDVLTALENQTHGHHATQVNI